MTMAVYTVVRMVFYDRLTLLITIVLSTTMSQIHFNGLNSVSFSSTMRSHIAVGGGGDVMEPKVILILVAVALLVAFNVTVTYAHGPWCFPFC